jgi:hypothetical protein
VVGVVISHVRRFGQGRVDWVRQSSKVAWLLDKLERPGQVLGGGGRG